MVADMERHPFAKSLDPPLNVDHKMINVKVSTNIGTILTNFMMLLFYTRSYRVNDFHQLQRMLREFHLDPYKPVEVFS